MRGLRVAALGEQAGRLHLAPRAHGGHGRVVTVAAFGAQQAAKRALAVHEQLAEAVGPMRVLATPLDLGGFQVNRGPQKVFRPRKLRRRVAVVCFQSRVRFEVDEHLCAMRSGFGKGR